jgi:hypothetical protein
MIIPSPAMAGWSSGGGELIKYQRNPWWKTHSRGELVDYCVDMDATNFGVSRTVARDRIQKALAFWKREVASSSLSGFSRLEFRETDCTASTRLRFQLGTLSDSQESLFPNPEAYVGQAVMTDYDPEEKKGKGFIYIAPQHGPWGLDKDPLNAPNAWELKRGEVLQSILQHELGHTFGIGHLSSAEMWTLMHEWFPTLAISQAQAAHFPAAASHSVTAFRAEKRWSEESSICQGSIADSPGTQRVGTSIRGDVADLISALGLPAPKGMPCVKFRERESFFEVAYRPEPNGPNDDAPVVYRLPLSRKDIRQETIARVMSRSTTGWSASGVLSQESSLFVAKGRNFTVTIERTPNTPQTGSRFTIDTPTRSWSFGRH